MAFLDKEQSSYRSIGTFTFCDESYKQTGIIEVYEKFHKDTNHFEYEHVAYIHTRVGNVEIIKWTSHDIYLDKILNDLSRAVDTSGKWDL